LIFWAADAEAIVDPFPLARDAERLARISADDNIHRSTPRAAVKGGNVVPQRRFIQGRVFHPRHEGGRSIGFPLDVTHSAIPGTGSGEPEVDSTGSGAERKAVQARVFSSGSVSGGR